LNESMETQDVDQRFNIYEKQTHDDDVRSSGQQLRP
jgi:hypothetical protein